MKDTFRIDPPTVPPTPVVFDSPHSGRTYPPDFNHSLDLALLRQAEDTHVESLFGHVPKQGAPLLYALFPRTYLDVNRAIEDVDPAMIDGEWPLPVLPSERQLYGAGLFWRRVGGDRAIYARRLKTEEALRRIYFCWRPYHEALKRLIDEAHARHGVAYHVNCHSMPSAGDPSIGTGQGVKADFVVGDRDGTTCEGDFLRLVRDKLKDLGYVVQVNDPYKGVEVLRRHGQPSTGRHSLQIEVNRRLYMDEGSRTRNGYYAKMKRDLEQLSATIIDYALARSAAVPAQRRA
jgi:N-formylglutamate deformylase